MTSRRRSWSQFAFPILGELQAEGCKVDGYWADDARMDERPFKKQRDVDPAQYGKSARIATKYMDVVVTSGVATGHAADVGKIDTFREHCGDTALGLASGITPENAGQYADAVDLFMVATGINHDGDFYNIDPERLKRLMDLTQT